MTAFNLIRERWLPVRRRSGHRSWMAPHEIVEADDPAVAIASPRPDFDAALTQFLVGLVQTCCPPPDGGAWDAWMEAPPAPAALQGAFEPVAAAFELLGPGARFLQDLDLPDAPSDDARAIEQLLIDAPGDQTLEQNKDLFVHRGRTPALSRAMAAAALYTMQVNSPSGGRGYRTSIRGGGPLTTLALGRTLWEHVWLNVLTERAGLFPPLPSDLGQVFPWLRSTRTSEARGSETFPADIHPLQVFWSMPRRIRLCAGGPGICGLTGTHEDCTIGAFHSVWYGTNYVGAHVHPLSPYRQIKPNEPPLPMKGRRSAVAFTDWPALALGASDVRLARCVDAYHNEGRGELLGGEPARLWISGYEMDNAKALLWADAASPLPRVEAARVQQVAGLCQRLVAASEHVEKITRLEVRNAISRRPEDRRGDLSWIDLRFQAHLEAAFHAHTAALARHSAEPDAVNAEFEAWADELAHAARVTFDQCAQVSADLSAADLLRMAKARVALLRSTSPNSKKLRQILGLAEKR